MLKAGIAGVIALAAMGSSIAFAQTEASFAPQQVSAARLVMVSYGQIARLKSDLKLTAAQEPLWPAVERAFREIGQQQIGEGAAPQGFVQGIKTRAAAIGMNALALRQIAAAAYPLIRTLNDEQKQSALTFARSIGLDSVVASF